MICLFQLFSMEIFSVQIFEHQIKKIFKVEQQNQLLFAYMIFSS